MNIDLIVRIWLVVFVMAMAGVWYDILKEFAPDVREFKRKNRNALSDGREKALQDH